MKGSASLLGVALPFYARHTPQVASPPCRAMKPYKSPNTAQRNQCETCKIRKPLTPKASSANSFNSQNNSCQPCPMSGALSIDSGPQSLLLGIVQALQQASDKPCQTLRTLTLETTETDPLNSTHNLSAQHLQQPSTTIWVYTRVPEFWKLPNPRIVQTMVSGIPLLLGLEIHSREVLVQWHTLFFGFHGP